MQGEHRPVLASHGRGQPLVVSVPELVAHTPVVKRAEADEVEPSVGLDELAIEILGGPPAVLVVAVGVDAALVLHLHFEQPVVRRILVQVVW